MGRELRGTTVRPPMLPTMPGLISASPKAREQETRCVKHQNDGAPRPLAVVWLLWFQTWMTDAEILPSCLCSGSNYLGTQGAFRKPVRCF